MGVSDLYLRFGSILKRIRERKGLTIQGLSALSGVRENALEAAESGTIQMTDEESKDLRDIYWTLETDQASAADYKRIVDQRLSVPRPNFGFPMREIRKEKELTIEELSTLSGISAEILERAEAGSFEMTDEDSEEMRRVYWSLGALEATPGDYRRLLADIAMKANAG